MTSLPDDEISVAFVEAFRISLKNHRKVNVPGMGTFQVEHKASGILEHPDGTVAIAPPRDEISFIADK